MENILEVKNLTKKFGPSADGFTAVDNISFSLKEGEILGLLGPNGAGKTTTIQMLLNVLVPTSGTIEFFGKNFDSDREDILRQINFASTYISLPWQFTIKEILDIFGRLYSVKDREKRIKKLLQAFNVEYLENTQFYKLSAGEKTRIFLAKAFLNYPKAILLDEPTASLDPEVAIIVREFLKIEQQEYNTSMLFTSHNMSEVEEMCNRVIIINHGKIIAQDTPENLAGKITACKVTLVITKNMQNAITFFKEKNIVFEKDRFQFTFPMDEKEIAAFLMSLASEKIDYQEISINKPELEDYFLQVLEEKI